MPRRPAVIIEEADCTLCRGKNKIVTGRVAGDSGGYRLTEGCKATFGVNWRRVTDRKARAPWVKKYWELVEERGQ